MFEPLTTAQNSLFEYHIYINDILILRCVDIAFVDTIVKNFLDHKTEHQFLLKVYSENGDFRSSWWADTWRWNRLMRNEWNPAYNYIVKN